MSKISLKYNSKKCLDLDMLIVKSSKFEKQSYFTKFSQDKFNMGITLENIDLLG